MTDKQKEWLRLHSEFVLCGMAASGASFRTLGVLDTEGRFTLSDQSTPTPLRLPTGSYLAGVPVKRSS